MLIVDSSIVQKIPETKAKIFKIQSSEIAEKIFGAKIYGDLIILGALTGLTKAVSKELMIKAIRETISVKTIKMNLNAFEKGLTLAAQMLS